MFFFRVISFLILLLTANMTSKLCRYFLAGYCREGDNCMFIHAKPFGINNSYSYQLPPMNEG